MARKILSTAGLRLGLALAALFAVGPLWAMGYMAFDESIAAFPRGFRIWPEEFGLDLFGWTFAVARVLLPGL